MSEPTLIRVDFRLLHGMVATHWVRSLKIVDIYIVDNNVRQDEFLRQVFDLAKPVGTTVTFLSVAEAIDKWVSGGFEETAGRPSLVLIKNIYAAKELYDGGMKFHRLVIGNSEVSAKKKHFNNVYYMDDDDARLVNAIADDGVEITLQEQTVTKSIPWSRVREKHFRKV